MPNSAFCSSCAPQIKELGYPTTLNGFLSHCGCNLSAFTKEKKNKRIPVLKDISQNIEITNTTIGEKTGTSMILRSQVLKESDISNRIRWRYNLVLVGLVTKNDYSCGLVFFVHSSGIIR
jgi:hypothetical protein